MKYLDDNAGMRDADSGDETGVSVVQLQHELRQVRQQLLELLPGAAPLQKAELLNRMGELLVDLNEKEEGYAQARAAFDLFVAQQAWESAAHACNTMFQAEQPQSLAALGQGVWLAVTFPIDPELSVALLQHIIDETPPDADGAAVAAITAHYVVDLRATGKQRDNLLLFTNNLLATVARRHSDVVRQDQFDYWMQKLELNDPAKFLPRLRNVIDVLVQDDWWVDRDAIWATLPQA
jgi:hypothetical protein